MVKLSLTGLTVFALLTAACGGSPTSPQTLDKRAANSAAVANDPAPTPPAPVPEPPAPAPSPAPTPAPEPPSPAPPSVETWYATVEMQRAAPGHELPATFTVTVSGDKMQFGPLEVTILARDGRHIYARKGVGLTIEIDEERWNVTSVDVFATGTISYTAK